MRRFVPAVLLAFLVSIPSIALSQGKVTKDPNKAGALTAKVEVDSRLQQKITYYSGYKRLHDITDDLSRISGVKILSGKSKDDWRVKDIPLVVCVKNMPLGNLLKAIADASHTYLGSERTVKGDPEKSYRIYRRYVDEAKIDSYFEKVRNTSLAQIKWQWDVMVAYGKSKEIDGIPKNTWYLSKVIASLGDNGWKRLQDGLTLRVAENQLSGTAREGFDELFVTGWNYKTNELAKAQESVSDQSTFDDILKSATLEIKYTDKRAGDQGTLAVHMLPASMDVTMPDGSKRTHIFSGGSGYSPSDIRKLDGKLPGLQPFPKSVSLPSLADDISNPDMLHITGDKKAKLPEVLNKKIDMIKPEDAKDITFAEIVRQLSDVSGLNIIAEDFKDQYIPSERGSDSWFAKATTLADTLRRTRYGANRAGCEWFFSEKQNLLLGWADDRDTALALDSSFCYYSTWRYHHKNLVPEAYLNSLKQKLHGDGLDFDDAMRLKALPRGLYEEWICKSNDLDCLSTTDMGQDSGWWMLYNALTPDDKQLAKSTGLPLGKFDTNWIASFFRTQRLGEDLLFSSSSNAESARQLREAMATKERVMSDPEIISTMVMRLVTKPTDTRMVQKRDENGLHATIARAPAELKLYSCLLEVDYQMDGKKNTLRLADYAYTSFPIRSPEREAQIIQAAKAAEAKTSKAE